MEQCRCDSEGTAPAFRRWPSGGLLRSSGQSRPQVGHRGRVGGRAGPLRRSGKGSKLTLEEGKVSLEALMQGRGAWLSRDGDWGDWGQGCRGHLADQLGRSAFLCGVCVVVLVVVRVMAGDELAYEDSYLHSTFFLSGSWEKPRSLSGRSSPPLVCLPALMRPCWTPRSSLQG